MCAEALVQHAALRGTACVQRKQGISMLGHLEGGTML